MEFIFSIIVLSVSVQPMLASTYNQSAAITTSLLLPCHVQVSLNKQARVMWVGPKGELISIDEEKRTREARIQVMRPNKQQFNIRLTNAKKTDEGTYTCKVMQGERTLSFDTFHVNILTPPTMVTSVMNERVVKEGDSVSLPCEATGDPEPRLEWRYSDPDLPGLPTEIETKNPELLTLSKVKLSMNGRYECIADNGVAPSHESVYEIQINALPKIQLPYVKVTQGIGDEVLMQCIVHWWPVGEVIWQFNNINIISTPHRVKESNEMYGHYKDVLNSQENVNKINKNNNNNKKNKYKMIQHNVTSKTSIIGLMIENFTKLDIGRYKCIVNNEMGSSEASIIAMGDESSSSKDIHALVGDDVVIPCSQINNNNNNINNNMINNNNTTTNNNNNNNNKKNDNKNSKEETDIKWWRQTNSMKEFEKIEASMKSSKNGKFRMLKENELKIASIKHEDGGFYRCHVGGTVHQMAYISVTHTSASSSSMLGHKGPAMISIRKFVVTLCALVLIMTAVFATVLFVVLRRKRTESFNFGSSKAI